MEWGGGGGEGGGKGSGGSNYGLKKVGVDATTFFIYSLNKFVLKKKNRLCLLVFFNQVPYIVCAPLSEREGGLDRISGFRGDCWERGGELFQG